MPELGESQVFWPGPHVGPCFIVAAISFGALGVFILSGVLIQEGELSWRLACFGFMMVAASGFALLGGVAGLQTTVTVNPEGLTKVPQWNGGFTIAWDQVLTWSAIQGIENSWVEFQITGQRRVLKLFDSEVGYPGFEVFLQAIRVLAGDRENRPRSGS